MSESEPVEPVKPTQSEGSCLGPMLIGCGTAVVVALIFAAAMTFLGNQFWDFVSDQTRRVHEEAQFAENWHAPGANAPIEAFSPETVNGFTFQSADQNADFPALGIGEEGYRILYERGAETAGTIEVTVYRMNRKETTALFDDVERRIADRDRFPNYQLTRMPNVLDFHVETGPLAGRLWHSQGWLIFIRGQSDQAIADFARPYLNAVGQGAGDEPAEASEPVATKDGLEDSQ